jgi:hypothetical protein
MSTLTSPAIHSQWLGTFPMELPWLAADRIVIRLAGQLNSCKVSLSLKESVMGEVEASKVELPEAWRLLQNLRVP